MKRIKIIFSVFWFAFVSVIFPAWMGLIYMNITGHGKGYAYKKLFVCIPLLMFLLLFGIGVLVIG